MATFIELTGEQEALHDLHGIESRMVHADPAFEHMLDEMEDEEAKLFNSFGGRYVLTGALKASLTQPSANDAIREAHGDSLQFGTSIPYAVFNRPVLAEIEPRKASAIIMAHIMGRL